MDNFDNTFDRFRQHSPAHPLSEDFEDRVFVKIKKKKRQRKAAASAALTIAVFAFIFIAQAVFLPKDPERKPLIAQPLREKEEVPVMEDVIFASSDSQTNYAIEQVAYYEDDNTI
jgi:hypothetical protein